MTSGLGTIEVSSSATDGAEILASGFASPDDIDFADFAMPTRAELLALFPQHGHLVQELSRAAK